MNFLYQRMFQSTLSWKLKLEVAWIVSALQNYLVSISWSVISVFLEPVFFTIVGKKSFFLHSGSNNQLSCSILMHVGDYERTINYDWPYPFGSNSFATSHVLSWVPIHRNPLYYKVFGIKHISVGDTQKHLSSANAKQHRR